MLLLIDSSLVLQIVLYDRNSLTDLGVISDILVYIDDLVADVGCEACDVIVAVEGVGPADVLERRRRAAYARGHAQACQAWDVNRALPGTPFMTVMVESLLSRGWRVASGGGACLVTLAQQMRLATAGFTLIARERDADALAAMCSFALYVVWEDGYRRDYEVVQDCAGGLDGADAVVLDILTGGGCGGERQGDLVQDLPGLPRMPGTFAAEALERSYVLWRGDDQKRLTKSRGDFGFCLDRAALVEMLTMYTEHPEGGENDDRTALEDWSGVGWRAAHIGKHFPHGFDGACAHYLDAIDRELCHLGGSVSVDSASVYVHGCAPSALDIVNDAVPAHGQCSEGTTSRAQVSTWSAEMQLIAILPRRPESSPMAKLLQTQLDMGCVHMFPVSYRVWWGVYPVIPLIDFELFEAGYRRVVAQLA